MEEEDTAGTAACCTVDRIMFLDDGFFLACKESLGAGLTAHSPPRFVFVFLKWRSACMQ